LDRAGLHAESVVTYYNTTAVTNFYGTVDPRISEPRSSEQESTTSSVKDRSLTD